MMNRLVVTVALILGFGVLLSCDNANSGASGNPLLANNPITAGLIAGYEFTGNADDVSGNGNNGVVNGATLTTDRFGNAESAYLFDGINDIISVGAVLTTLNSPSSLSIFAWIKRGGTSTQFWDDIVAGDCGAPLFGIQDSSQLLGFGGQCDSPMTITFDSSVITDTLWHSVAATYDGTTVNVYRDGTLVASGAKTGSFNTALTLGIGGASGSPINESFNGSIDDVYLYNRALSALEISTIHSS